MREFEKKRECLQVKVMKNQTLLVHENKKAVEEVETTIGIPRIKVTRSSRTVATGLGSRVI